MLNKPTRALAFCIGAIASFQAAAWTNTEFYYTPQIPNLQTIIVNNPGFLSRNPTPGLNLLANSIVNTNSTMQPISPNVWSGYPWTGLDPVDRTENSQRALMLQSSQQPGYGSTIFQKDWYSVGMHLNTFEIPTLPGGQVLTSLQYRVDVDQPIWNTNDFLCMSGTMNIPTSYTEGAVNQVMMTMFFNDRTIDKSVVLNVMMFDSRYDWQVKDYMITDTDKAGANPPIAISHMQSQGQDNSRYSIPIPGYGNPLAAFERGSTIPGNRDRGFCIGIENFRNIINDARALQPSMGFSANPAAYDLKIALVGPETNISGGRGHIGMSVSSLWIYRRG